MVSVPDIDEDGAPSTSSRTTEDSQPRERIQSTNVSFDISQSTDLNIKDMHSGLGGDLEELDRLQRVLDEMTSECARSPSTSQASTSSKDHAKGALPLAARRLVRVPCYSDEQTPFTIQGGAALSRLISVDLVRHHDLVGILNPGDVLLAVDDVAVSGMLRSDVQDLLETLCANRDQIAIEVVPKDSVPDDLCLLLADRTWMELQTVIRDNVYSKTVPYTTRPPREGEIDGEHYRFVSEEHFNQLKESAQLLEHGSYQGYLYGTPRPVEMVSGPSKGPLPPNWEVAYDENGEKYYIDHNNGTTQWDDPRDLPDGWEQVDDPVYGTFYVDHVNKRTTYERPGPSSQPLHSRPISYPNSNGVLQPYGQIQHGSPSRQSRRDLSGYGSPSSNPVFTRDPQQLKGEIVRTRMVKGPKGLGFTLIGNDASSRGDEFIQVKSILPGGAAEANGVLRPGDVLVRVNREVLLGATQSDACRIFVGLQVGDQVDIEVCRGYPLILDPANRIVTESVYETKHRDGLLDIDISKGMDGFGFTITDNASGQRVKKILYPAQCPNLLEGDIICELDGRNVRGMPHTRLVETLRELPIGYRGRLTVKRGSPKQRSRTPTAAFRYGGERATPAPSIAPRSKTPAPNGRDSYRQNGNVGKGGTLGRYSVPPTTSADVMDGRLRPSSTTLGFSTTPSYMPISAFNRDSLNLITVNLIRKPQGFGFRLLGGSETGTQLTVGQIVPGGAAADDGRLKEGDEIMEINDMRVEGGRHSEAVALLEKAAHTKHVKIVVRRPSTNAHGVDMSRSVSVPVTEHRLSQPGFSSSVGLPYDVVLHRPGHDGFGFIILSSMKGNGSTIGQIIDGSPADLCGRLSIGDRVLAVNGTDIANLDHVDIVGLIKASGLTVRLTIMPDPSGSGPPATTPASGTLARNLYSIPPTPTPFNPPPPPQSTNYAGYGSFQPSSSSYPPPPQHFSGAPPTTNIMSAQKPNGYGGNNYDSYSGMGMGMQREITPDQEEIVEVELHRGSRGFGFSIRGGQEFSNMPLFVLRIAEDGAAAMDGRLRVGDRLVRINGTDTRGLTHEQAINLIKQHPTVRLSIGRSRLP